MRGSYLELKEFPLALSTHPELILQVFLQFTGVPGYSSGSRRCIAAPELIFQQFSYPPGIPMAPGGVSPSPRINFQSIPMYSYSSPGILMAHDNVSLPPHELIFRVFL